jgi:hypothetical protein
MFARIMESIKANKVQLQSMNERRVLLNSRSGVSHCQTSQVGGGNIIKTSIQQSTSVAHSVLSHDPSHPSTSNIR